MGTASVYFIVMLYNTRMTMINLKCPQCTKQFEAELRYVNKNKKRGSLNFCSHSCMYKYRLNSIKIICETCGLEFSRPISQINSSHNFCSSSCFAVHYNKHKNSGCRKSKFEILLIQSIKNTYPNLFIIENGVDLIGMELDVYFPSLDLAIEINGIHHYKPIHGKERLKNTVDRDAKKVEKCKKRGTKLFIYDISTIRNVKSKLTIKFINIIIDDIGKEISSNFRNRT